MTLTKNVNGRRVTLSPEEEAEVRAQWNANVEAYVPTDITIRQLIIGALLADWITPEEADAWATRTALPQIVRNIIEELPPDQQPLARITALTMTVAERNNPLIDAAAEEAMPTLSPIELKEAVDNYFRDWSQL